MSYMLMELQEGQYELTSRTYKHIPKKISLKLENGKVHYIRISHGTGWIDIWYDLLISNKKEFEDKLNIPVLGEMKRVN